VDEIWGVIPDFENYSVSNYGAVRNERGHLLTGHVNQSGLVYVSLHRYGREYNRSLAPIVARVFVGPPAHISWNTVIHLNGNRKDMFEWRMPAGSIADKNNVIVRIDDTGRDDLALAVYDARA